MQYLCNFDVIKQISMQCRASFYATHMQLHGFPIYMQFISNLHAISSISDTIIIQFTCNLRAIYMQFLGFVMQLIYNLRAIYMQFLY